MTFSLRRIALATRLPVAGRPCPGWRTETPRVHRPGFARGRLRPDLQAGTERTGQRKDPQQTDARHLHARRSRRGGVQRRGCPAPADAGTLVAWSSGSLLNLAQGKFGRFDENAVRWLAAVGTSYGAIAVKSDSPYKTLDDLVAALKKDPGKVVIGSGGTVGSQDWMQTALIAKAAGINPRDLRYVALEGGGEIATRTAGRAHPGGQYRTSPTPCRTSRAATCACLAVFPEKRLDEPEMKDIPTAKEQGYDIVWPVVRGFYLGPKVDRRGLCLVEGRLRQAAGLG